MRATTDFARAIRGGQSTGQPALVAHLSAAPRSSPGAPVHPDGDENDVAESESGTSARVGFVVSRAVGSAVVRNRVRRRLQALMAQRLSTLPPGALLVVRARPMAATMSSVALGRQLDRALARVTGDRRRTKASSRVPTSRAQQRRDQQGRER
jgi:ribonuclease P protein component